MTRLCENKELREKIGKNARIKTEEWKLDKSNNALKLNNENNLSEKSEEESSNNNFILNYIL